MKVKIDC